MKVYMTISCHKEFSLKTKLYALSNIYMLLSDFSQQPWKRLNQRDLVASCQR